MRILPVLALGCLVMGGAYPANVIPGDARRGAQLFEAESCVQCHSINGRGGNVGPDLGKRLDRNYTPAVMASLMWNHAPAMWQKMRERGVTRPTLTPQQAADLFAFFFSARFFEKQGDAGRGKLLFTSKHCSGCHGITTSNAMNAPPVAKWDSLADSIVLVQQMWNHSAKMREAFAKRGLRWERLTAQDLTDMLVYLQNLPETRGLVAKFSFPRTQNGEELFGSKGCGKCHVGKLAIEERLRGQTLTEVAAGMWNHPAHMQGPVPELSEEEMRQIVTYAWARQFLRGAGSPDRGRRVFQDRKCVVCHEDRSSGAPNLAKNKGNYSGVLMVSALWEHGPQMLTRMGARNIPWPRFNGVEMSDLIAYLNTLQ